MAMKERMKGGPRSKPTSLQVMVKGIERGMWTTPRANDAKQSAWCSGANGSRILTLTGHARKWPTPQARDSHNRSGQADRYLIEKRYNLQDKMAADGIHGSGREVSGHWDVEPNVGRVADGVASRVDRLRGLGNAVVPQIPELIGHAIIKYDATL
jgi:hypothetical protein